MECNAPETQNQSQNQTHKKPGMYLIKNFRLFFLLELLLSIGKKTLSRFVIFYDCSIETQSTFYAYYYRCYLHKFPVWCSIQLKSDHKQLDRILFSIAIAQFYFQSFVLPNFPKRTKSKSHANESKAMKNDATSTTSNKQVILRRQTWKFTIASACTTPPTSSCYLQCLINVFAMAHSTAANGARSKLANSGGSAAFSNCSFMESATFTNTSVCTVWSWWKIARSAKFQQGNRNTQEKKYINYLCTWDDAYIYDV